MSGWEKIKSKIVHKNPWFSLREDDVIIPNGKRGKYYYIDNVKSVATIAEASDDEIYLIGQQRYTVDKYSWEIVGGGINKNEDSLVAAKRELKEETGFSAKSFKRIGSFSEANCYANLPVEVFLASGLSEGKTNFDQTEDIVMKKIKIAKVKEMILKNKMFDSFSIASFYKYLLNKKI